MLRGCNSAAPSLRLALRSAIYDELDSTISSCIETSGIKTLKI